MGCSYEECKKVTLKRKVLAVPGKSMVFFSFPVFFQKYSELIQGKQFTQETTHTILECKKEKLIMEGKN